MEELNRDIGACQRCDLARHRARVVPGEGPADSVVLFIGEAPGFHEDQQGRPFVGPAGQFLNQLLILAGLRREQVFICNVIKCRPPENRDPLPTEIQACRPWLDRQIELIEPKVVVTLGRYSMARYFPGAAMSKVHGKHIKRDGIVYFAMYHPAAALHQQSLRKAMEQDALTLKQVLSQLEPASAGPGEPESRQLSMF
ncbi:MAG: uracil-DNA glycosylase [Chloroflexi bacterium]|nr:uracil-DNA glycosylase [Chloroflexota bacterium]